MAVVAANAELRNLALQFLGGGYDSWPVMPARYLFRARELLHGALALNVRPPADRMAALSAQAAGAYRWAMLEEMDNLGSFIDRLRIVIARAPRNRAVLMRQVQDLLRAQFLGGAAAAGRGDVCSPAWPCDKRVARTCACPCPLHA